MKLGAVKERLLNVLQLVLLVWPALHLLGAGWFGFNSWKLGGWGMYASLRPSHIQVYVGGVDTLVHSEKPPRALAVTSEKRRWLRVLPHGGALRNLLADTGNRVPGLVLFKQPRLNLLQGISRCQVRVFLVSPDRVTTWVESEFDSWQELCAQLGPRLQQAGYPGRSAKGSR